MKLAISSGWQDNKAKLIDGSYSMLGMQRLEQRFGKHKLHDQDAQSQVVRKAPRLVDWEPQPWTLDDGHHRLEVCGDSRVVINWLNGIWPVKFLPYLRRVQGLHRQLHEMVACGDVRPRQDSADFCRHVFRELNGQADALANRHCNTWHLDVYDKPATCIRAFFDGSVRRGKSAFGWIVLACPSGDADMELWRTVASKSGSLPDGATITAAELEGSLSLLSFLHSYYQSYHKSRADISALPSMDYVTVRSPTLADLV